MAVLAATFQACYFTAVWLTTVGLATLVTIGAAPVVVVAVETLQGRARRGSLPVVVLALLGLGLLVGMPATGADPLAGAAAAVFAGSAFAVMTLAGARPVPGLDPMVATGASFVVGGLLLAVPTAMLGRLSFPVTFSGVGLLALFAVLPTALAYTAYFRGLGAGASPGTGAVLALLEPLTAAVLAATVLGERLHGTAGHGSARCLATPSPCCCRAARRGPCKCSAAVSGSRLRCRCADRAARGGPADQPGECGEVRGRGGPAPGGHRRRWVGRTEATIPVIAVARVHAVAGCRERDGDEQGREQPERGIHVAKHAPDRPGPVQPITREWTTWLRQCTAWQTTSTAASVPAASPGCSATGGRPAGAG